MFVGTLEITENNTGRTWFGSGGIMQKFDLKGAVDIKTNSRSAQNPLFINAKLTQVLDPIFGNYANWDMMPNSLYYNFSGALEYPIITDQYGIPKPAILELKKHSTPPYYEGLKKYNGTNYYEGNMTAVYQDAGDYDFNLVESTLLQQPIGQSKEIVVPDYGKGVVKYYIVKIDSTDDDKIKIEPFSSTINFANYKLAIYGIILTVMTLIPLKLNWRELKHKIISNKS
jgi:hypothetical protein